MMFRIAFCFLAKKKKKQSINRQFNTRTLKTTFTFMSYYNQKAKTTFFKALANEPLMSNTKVYVL
jgi:hypothetical protein